MLDTYRTVQCRTESLHFSIKHWATETFSSSYTTVPASTNNSGHSIDEFPRHHFHYPPFTRHYRCWTVHLLSIDPSGYILSAFIKLVLSSPPFAFTPPQPRILSASCSLAAKWAKPAMPSGCQAMGASEMLKERRLKESQAMEAWMQRVVKETFAIEMRKE